MTQISIADLERITQAIFEHLKEINISTIDLSEDLYWHVLEGDIYNMKAVPVDLGVGQLSDDWEQLTRLLTKDRDPLAYDLVALSAISRAIGEQISG